MSYIVMKPVHWNLAGYERPSGFRASKKSYAGEFGFGHEEWNNSPLMRVKRDGVWYRLFHTEQAGDTALGHPGDVTIFMYASHDGVQQLVGVAGKATYLLEDAAERAELRAMTRFDTMGEQAWTLPSIQDKPAFKANQKAFARHWENHSKYMPTWLCPEDHFLWLEEPATLDAQRITGKAKLLTMYSKHTVISEQQAHTVMGFVPKRQRAPAWSAIAQSIDFPLDAVSQDVQEILKDRRVKATTRLALVASRLGQGRYRAQLVRRWEGRCAVSGCSMDAALRASHIRPWRDSDNDQRLDPANGLLLVANLDALFDRGFISFGADGKMLVSAHIQKRDRAALGVPQSIRMPLTKAEQAYLRHHRRAFAFDD